MRLFLAIAFALVATSSTSNAALILRIDGPASVQQGNVAQFNVYLSSDQGPQTVNYIEFLASAGPGDGSAGTFTAASQISFLLGSNGAFDLSDTTMPGTAYSINQGSSAIVDSEVLYATLHLNTAAAQLGNYTISLVDPLAFFFSVPIENSVEFTVQSNPLPFDIVAVPEPVSTTMLVASGGLVAFCRIKRNRRRSMRPSLR